MNLVSVVASGLFSFFNRVILNGLLGKAIFGVILTWVISAMLSGMVGAITGILNLPSFTGLMAPFGSAGQLFVYLFSFLVAPGLSALLAGVTLRFIIRRVPFVG